VVRVSNASSKHGGRARAGRRAETRRVEILRAAAAVFRTRGYARAGMRDIAMAANLSPANLYHYFGGKEQLLFFCQDRALDGLLASARDAGSTTGPLVPRLLALADAHVRCLIGEVEGSTAHFEVDALPPGLRARIVAKRDRYEQQVRALIAAGIHRGELSSADATIATRAFLGSLNWTAQWFRPEGADSVDRVATVVAQFAVAGLQPVAARGGVRADRPHGQRRASRRPIRTVQDTP
jgi:AcrR family transcriptional regulator